MQIVQTAQGETVLSHFFPLRLNQVASSSLYSGYVGAKLPENKLYVVLGTDSGLLVDYLSKIATTGQRFVCVDFPEVIDYLKEHTSLLLNDKFEFYSFDEFDFEILYESHQDYVIRNAIILLKSYLLEEDQGVYKGLFKKMEEAFQRFRIDRVDNRDFKKVFNQQLVNICDLMYPMQDIKGELAGNIPGIILGGGPSLDDVIPWLKAHQKQIWIFAASRICKRLLKEGIDPDFIATLDPQPLIFDYSKEMFEFQDKSILLTGEHPYPGLIRQWRGLKTYTRRRFPWARNSEENFISDGPTVTNALFGMASFLGVSQIYLAGVDFCFTLEGVCHESSSIESVTEVRDNPDTYAVNYRGEQVGTNIQLYDARNLFEEQFANLSNLWPELRSYNLNSGAAVIKGIDFKPIDSVELGEYKFNVVERFKADLSYDVKSMSEYLSFIKAEINSHSKWFSLISREAKKGLQQTELLFKDPVKQAVRVKKILKQKDKLEQIVGVDYQTMVNYAYTEFMQTLQPVESNLDMTYQEISNSFKGFFGGLNKGAENFLEQLDLIKVEIDFRTRELNPETPLPNLIEEWVSKNIPGRFYVWLEHLALEDYQYYLNRYPQEVKLVESLYKKLVKDDSKLQAFFNERRLDPKEYVYSLKNAINLKQIDLVRQVIGQLTKLPKNKFEHVLGFAQGALLEMQGQLDEALEKYLSIDKEKKWSDVQERVFPLAFSLQKHEVGLESLESLCQVDSRYIPVFADSLAVLGHIDGAIDTYKIYPLLNEDTDSVINLIRLYVRQSRIEEANQLLEKSEGNKLLDQSKLQNFVNSLNEIPS